MSLPHATFAVIVDPETHRIIEAAPIAGWTVGKRARFVWDYYANRGGDVLWMGWAE